MNSHGRQIIDPKSTGSPESHEIQIAVKINIAGHDRIAGGIRVVMRGQSNLVRTVFELHPVLPVKGQ